MTARHRRPARPAPITAVDSCDRPAPVAPPRPAVPPPGEDPDTTVSVPWEQLHRQRPPADGSRYALDSGPPRPWELTRPYRDLVIACGLMAAGCLLAAVLLWIGG